MLSHTVFKIDKKFSIQCMQWDIVYNLFIKIKIKICTT